MLRNIFSHKNTGKILMLSNITQRAEILRKPLTWFIRFNQMLIKLLVHSRIVSPLLINMLPACSHAHTFFNQVHLSTKNATKTELEFIVCVLYLNVCGKMT